MTELPVIDAAALLSGPPFDSARARQEIAALFAACTEHGFFYLRGHGVAEAEERRLFELSRRLFALPFTEKLAIENVRSAQFRGYTRVGQERTQGVPDQREQLDVGAERPPPAEPVAPLYLRLRGPNQWPSALPELRGAVLAWLAKLDQVAMVVVRALAAALGQNPFCFDAKFLPEPDSHVKLIRYPGTPEAEPAFGVGSHKDYGFLAFVLQDDQGGLELQSPSGAYMPAPPLPGTLVGNIGEMFEIASGGLLRATQHRVRSPRAPQERFSFGHFFSPRLEAVVGELALPAELEARRRRATPDPHNPIFAEFGKNALRGWVRSHPRVAERHYPELTPQSIAEELET
jgi:isopenicillin N synthase-like dioxygenase